MKQRVAYIDIAKAIGITLVILGHMEISGNLYNYLFSFHMPLFIILSGMVFKRERIWKNVKVLLISFLSLTIILSVADVIVKWLVKHESIDVFTYVKAILGGAAAPNYRFDPAPAIWFLTALIIIELFSYLLHFLGRFRWLLIPGLIALGVVLSFFKENSYIPWNIDAALFLIPFFELGKLSKDWIAKIKIKSLFFALIGLSALLFLIPLSMLNGAVNIYRCQWGNNLLLYYINSLIGSTAIIFISIGVSSVPHTKFICWLGKNTVVPMAAHQFILPYAAIIMGYIPYYGRFVFTIIELIIMMTACYLVAWLVGRFCPVILGKTKKKTA